MKRVIINTICAIAMMLIQSNFHSAFGIEIMVHFTLIAAVLCCAMAMPPFAGSISVLILGLICDMMVSGPAGFYALILSIVYVLMYLVMSRLRSDRIITMMLYTAIASILFDLLLTAGYCLIYRSWMYWTIFVRHFYLNALLTAVFAPIMMYLVRFLEKVFTRRKTSGLS